MGTNSVDASVGNAGLGFAVGSAVGKSIAVGVGVGFAQGSFGLAESGTSTRPSSVINTTEMSAKAALNNMR